MSEEQEPMSDPMMAEEQEDRILNQAEIDSLFGVSEFDAPQGNDIERLIGAPLASHERLPMLEIVFDRLTRILSTSLRNFTNDNVEVSVDRLNSQRFGDYIDSVSGPSMYAVFWVEEWENYGVLVISSQLIYLIVDALLGGDRRNGVALETTSSRTQGRHHTTIERSLIEPMVRIILADLATSFAPLCAVNFRFERLELNARSAAISRNSNGIIQARFCIEMSGRGGDVDLILPHATLEPVREILLQQFMGEKFGHDYIWETHLAHELWLTEVELDVVLDEQVMKLHDVMALRPGSQLILRNGARTSVHLRCGEKTLFEGRVGQRKGKVAVRIERNLNDRSADGDGAGAAYS
ncbi:flagellar motor switch protein FliM [Tanticharoenia sakaeratensis]|uniref:Flagellar motor switch protein FliM n=1 Tax=Tanticharoenia sakaeratensis NBRC 103193 TaxID=1231623 RepID=A0A0D6MI82_9PROT|nr:flagellar motor switch protein FliM [Tanticharoenia sakaeratensis]GAN52978.1 flagellar motor switch protein FliM [Tanticharoenia sakaeratensis NBRC 103193]GBQ19879.1 flagellar motor switch protein FliM [Tanticharoenia sakaeratensis NBRC 103193]